MSTPSVNKSLFPKITSTAPAYDAIMEKPRKEYNEKYDSYTKKLGEIDATTQKWSKLTTEEIEKLTDADFKKDYVDVYRAHRDMREDCNRILNIYDNAIFQCKPPLTDEDIPALEVLSRLKFKIEDMEASYNKVFDEKLNQLIDQRTKIQQLYDKIVPPLFALKQAGEIIATKRDSSYQSSGIMGGLARGYNSLTGGYTPYFSKAVKSRDTEKLLATVQEHKSAGTAATL